MTFQPRFGQAADAYQTFRPDYPSEVFERVLAAVPRDRRDLAIDLGAGTGKATRILVEHFQQVIAIEADPLMAAKIPDAAPQAIVRIAKAEEWQQQPATVDLVNIATALHWMEVPVVIENVERWLRPGGVLAVYSGRLPETPEPIRSIVRTELHDHWNQFRDQRLRREDFPQSIVRAAKALNVVEDTKISYVVFLSAREFAGFWSSTSYAGAYARTLSDPQSYWRDLEERLGRAWPEERFPVDFSPYLLLARKE